MSKKKNCLRILLVDSHVSKEESQIGKPSDDETCGWVESHKAYNLQYGCWINLIYIQPNQFVIVVKLREGHAIKFEI